MMMKPCRRTVVTAFLLVAVVAAVGFYPATATPAPSEGSASKAAKPSVAEQPKLLLPPKQLLPPKLSLPIDCNPGDTCFVQSYVDIDPGPDARDYRCGSATYDGHKGVDFRLLSAAATHDGVAILAAADGVVKRMRDGMEDVFVTAATKAEVSQRGCGNSVLIDHGGGWQTLYCHMRKGSLAVRPGNSVQRGQRIGDVGYSGLAEFAHLHLMVMHDSTVIDPESGLGPGAACSTDDPATGLAPLWDATAAKAFTYHNGEFIGVGFSARQLSPGDLEIDHRIVSPDASSEALLFYARLINLRVGDQIRLSVTGPGGFSVNTTSKPIDRNKATYVAFAGRRLRAPKWPSGTYEGSAELIRGGNIIARSTPAQLKLP